MGRTLLIGNGLNRCIEGSVSWGDLLKDIANEYGVDYSAEIPMPLEFERIIDNFLAKNPNHSGVHEEIKDKIVKKMTRVSLPENSVHLLIKAINPSAIMTTNYDNLLEYVYDSSYVFSGNKQPKYLSEKTSDIEGTWFYHIHGVIDNPKSICLGYEHYIGVVQKLRNEINTDKKETQQNEPKMSILRRLSGIKDSTELKWGERFYKDDIDIIGLSLDTCEIDLWWILTHRAFLYFTNHQSARTWIANTVTYHDIVNDVEQDDNDKEELRKIKLQQQASKFKLLESQHVEVKKYLLSEHDKSYEKAYRRILEDIAAGQNAKNE